MLSLGQTLANAAGLRPRKKFHFEVVFKLEELLNCTYVSGVLFAKIRLKDGGHFSYSSQRCVYITLTAIAAFLCTLPNVPYSSVEVNRHKVSWEEEVRFSCKLYASANTAELEPCVCKVSVRKVGFVAAVSWPEYQLTQFYVFTHSSSRKLVVVDPTRRWGECTL